MPRNHGTPVCYRHSSSASQTDQYPSFTFLLGLHLILTGVLTGITVRYDTSALKQGSGWPALHPVVV